MAFMMRVGLVSIASLALGAFACTSEVHNGMGGAGNGVGGGAFGASGAAGNTASTAGAGPAGSAGDAPTTAADCVGKPAAPGRTPLRRLTATEFNNTVRDILADTTAPGSDFPPASVGSGFSNDADAYQTQLPDVQGWLNASETLAANYRAAGKLNLSCSADAQNCASGFIKTMGKQLFRRPLSDQEVTSYMARFSAGSANGGSFEEGLEWVLGRMLMSPHFLYRIELEAVGKPQGTLVALNDYSIATRLSYFLWSSSPDSELMAAADAHQLSTVDGIKTQVKRMMGTKAFADTLSSFHSQWVQWEDVTGAEKVGTTSPAWGPSVKADMIREAELFVKSVFDAGGSFKDLLTAKYSFVNPSLAQFYGLNYPGTGTDFVRVDIPHRAGLLTQPAILAGLAHPDQSAPVKRGLMVRSRMLCFDPPPPPMGVKIVIPPVQPGQTTKQRFAAHRTNEPCKSCHVFLDPLGLPFEHYDEFGRYRDADQGLPIDATGGFTMVKSKGMVVDPTQAPIDGADDLGAQLADLPEARQCLVQNWFRFAAGHQEENSDACTVYSLLDHFNTSGQKLDDLLVAIATSDSFRNRLETAP